MTKAEAYAIRNKSRRLICAFVVGALVAVLLFAVRAAVRMPGLEQVPICLLWLLIFVLVYRYRIILRRQSAWFFVALVACESTVIAVRGFDVVGVLHRDRMYAELSRAVRSGDLSEIYQVVINDPTPDYVPSRSLFCNPDQPCYSKSAERPMDIAIEANNLPAAQLLAEYGASVGPAGERALEAAAKRNDSAMLHFLLEHGAAPNLLSGESPALQVAVDEGSAEAVAVLLDARANPNSSIAADGQSAARSVLRRAQDENRRDVVLLLRRAGATE